MFISGAVPRKPDLRDIKLGAVQAPVVLPESYITDTTGFPEYFQNGFGTCGAHAGAFFQTVLLSKILNVVQNLSPRFLWDEIKEVDGIPIANGTDMRSIMATLKNKGICNYALLPNDYTIDVNAYTSPGNITVTMEADASPKKIAGYAFTNWPTVAEIKQAVYQNKSVILTLRNFGDSFFGSETPPFNAGTYGHFVECPGYDSQYLYIKDSTEVAFPYKKLDASWLPHIEELGTAVELTADQIKAQTQGVIALLQKLVVLYQQLLVLLKGRTN